MHNPSAEELVNSHEIFESKEARASDYWHAREGVEHGLSTGNLEEVANSIAEFLKSWNWDFYRFKPDLVPLIQADVLQLITEHLQSIQAFRARTIDTLTESDRPAALTLFRSFEQKLRTVGTAKALSCLAPQFFPLWDNAIAWAYGVVTAAHGYFLFMMLVKGQLASITLPNNLMPLKTLDEHNYCRYTKGWLP